MKAAYLDLSTTNPAYNLALEQYVFDDLPRDRTYLMLWQNQNAVIIGRHQNARAEVDHDYALRHNIQVVRRLSGGGAVYHDLGNLNFTFITNERGGGEDSFSAFCRPVIQALAGLGVWTEMTGRNDIVIQGKKISGNAQYRRQGRVMHHGTLLFDSDLAAAQAVLRPCQEKLSSKGVASVSSRITNIRPHLPHDMPLPAFREYLLRSILEKIPAETQPLSDQDLEAVERLRLERYASSGWNYGPSPKYTLLRRRRVEGCGLVEAKIIVEQGKIQNIAFSGDFFSIEEPEMLSHRFLGCPLEESACRAALSGVDVSHYFIGLRNKDLVELLTGSELYAAPDPPCTGHRNGGTEWTMRY